MSSSVQLHREALQRRTGTDWAQREYIELISGSLKRISDFLNAFDTSVRGRLSGLNEKLTQLERKVDYLEARVGMKTDAPHPEDDPAPHRFPSQPPHQQQLHLYESEA